MPDAGTVSWNCLPVRILFFSDSEFFPGGWGVCQPAIYAGLAGYQTFEIMPLETTALLYLAL
jgi:hypothetical protein